MPKDINLHKTFYNEFGTEVIPREIIVEHRDEVHYMCQLRTGNDIKISREYTEDMLFKKLSDVKCKTEYSVKHCKPNVMPVSIQEGSYIREYLSARSMAQGEKKNHNISVPRRETIECIKYEDLEELNTEKYKVYIRGIEFY